MNYATKYIQSAKGIIDLYHGDIPLAIFLKQFFAANKKFGSKDRKHIAALCYAYYRVGLALQHIDRHAAVKIAIRFCKPNDEQWKDLEVDIPVLSPRQLFPFINELSDGIKFDLFANAHLQQPLLFLRVRNGKLAQITKALENANIEYNLIDDTCISLANSTKLDGIGGLNRDYVVQDYSSQRVGEIMKTVDGGRRTVGGTEVKTNKRSTVYGPRSVWDCCAASGGKSILAKDVFGEIDLTVSDIRESILQNLKKRFREAEIFNYRSLICDLTQTIDSRLKIEDYDLVICDAPCTGSGTWARSPEQLYFFEEKRIVEFQSWQQKIITNTLRTVKLGGYYLYITCSVFKAENEQQVAFILKTKGFELIEQKLFAGYTMQADSMFGALFQKKV